MNKRVTGNYYIPDLSKGLIDGSSKGRVDDNYKKKCSELTNFWIKNNNNIAKRPPLRPVTGLEDLRHIIDVTETADRIVFLRQVDLNIPTDDEEGNPIQQVVLQHRRRTLLEEIGWRTGVATQVGEPGDEHIDYISPDDPVNFQLWHYGTAPDSIARDDGASVSDDELRELYPIVTVLDSYDKETHEHYLDERFYFVQWVFSNHQDSTEFRFGLDNAQGIYQADIYRDITIRSNVAYGGLTNINKTPLAAPAAIPNNDENSAARLLAHRQSRIFREYVQGLEAAPVHTFIINKGEVIDSRVVHDLKHHPEYGSFLNEISTSSLSRASLNQLRLYNVALRTYESGELLNIQENLFRDTSLPERVFTNHSGRVELYAFGLDYTWNKEELAPRLKSSEDLSESIMNTFVEKPTQINVDELEIQADITEVYETRTNLSLGSSALLRRVNPRLTLDDLINEIPDMIQIRDHLKFSLCNIANEVSLDPTYGNYSYIIPDLQIPIQGTDIPAYGQFLFEANYQGLPYNVFVMPYTYNQFYYDSKNPTPFRQTSIDTFEDEDGEVDNNGNIINRRQYPNGYGTGQGKAGVYLAFQRNNEIGDDGIPVFYPIITTFDAAQEIDEDNIEARTHYMVRLGLNLLDPKVREVMDDLKIISFYSSRGQNGFNAVGAVQIGNYVSNRSLNGFEARGRESLYNTGSRDSSFGRAVNISETGRHVLPWGNPDLFSIFWLYATSQPPTVGNQPRPVEKESQTAAGNVVFSWNTEAGAGTPVGAIDKSTDLFRNFDNSVLGGTESEGQGKRVYLLNKENNRLRTSLADTSAIARKALDAVSEGASDIEALFATTVFYSAFISEDGRSVQRRILRTTSHPDLSTITGDYFYLGDGQLYSALLLSESDFTDDVSLYNNYINEVNNVTLRDVISANASSLNIQDDLTNRETYTASFDTGLTAVTKSVEILTYYNNADTRSITVTEGTATRTFDVSRDATSANYYLQLRSNFQNELNSVGSLRGGEFYPESTVFLNYHPSTASVPFEADNRVAKAAGNTLAFSNTQEPLTALENAKFSQGYLRFLNSIITVGRHSGYIRAANLGIGISPFDRTRSPSEPQSLVLFNKDLSPVNIVDYVETARGGLAITDRRIYSISGFTSKITGRIIHESGFTKESLSDDSFVIGAEGDKIKAIRYYEEAGGYITDIVNSELSLPGNILQGVSLLDKHKILLFRCENTYNAETGMDTLYTLSVDASRRVKGFTQFTVPCEISYLIRIDKDRIGIVTTACEYLELDFNKDFNNEEGKWQDLYNGEYSTYECAFTPLPVLQVYADDFSVLKTTTLRYLVVGCNGHPAFDVQIIDGNTGQITRKTSFRRIRPNTVTVDSDFSGQVAVKNMPQNGSSQPELRISKTDDEYIEFSSINIQLGG